MEKRSLAAAAAPRRSQQLAGAGLRVARVSCRTSAMCAHRCRRRDREYRRRSYCPRSGPVRRRSGRDRLSLRDARHRGRKLAGPLAAVARTARRAGSSRPTTSSSTWATEKVRSLMAQIVGADEATIRTWSRRWSAHRIQMPYTRYAGGDFAVAGRPRSTSTGAAPACAARAAALASRRRTA
jgi:hypothetical protein